MKTRLLTKDEYLATLSQPVRDVTRVATNVIDIWPYVAAVPSTELWGREVAPGQVECVYRARDERFDHVLVVTTTRNVFLVVVIDLAADQILGHHLLDLNEEYGLLRPQ